MADYAKDWDGGIESSRQEMAKLKERVNRLIQSQLADASLKLQKEIKVMEAAVAKAIHTAPASPKAIHEMQHAIVLGYEKLAKIQAQQDAERRVLN